MFWNVWLSCFAPLPSSSHIFSFPGHGDFFCSVTCYPSSEILQHWWSQTETPQVHQQNPYSWTIVLHFYYVTRSHRPDFPLSHLKLLHNFLLNFQWINWMDSLQNSGLKSQALPTSHFDRVLDSNNSIWLQSYLLFITLVSGFLLKSAG